MRFYLLFIFISVNRGRLGVPGRDLNHRIRYTQSGDFRLLTYIPSWWKSQPGLVRVGGARPPPLSACYHHVQSCSVRSCWEGRCTPSVLSVLSVLCDLNPEPVQWVSTLLSELRCTLMSYSLHSVLSNSVPIEPLCNLMSYSLRRTELLCTQKSYSVPYWATPAS